MEFGSSSIHSWRGIPSRPSSRRSNSRARSDTTLTAERPDSSAIISPSLSHEIDHIKLLIGRSQEAPSLPPAGIISAQVFRQPTPTLSTVTQGHIYHELDQLKRRIREELEQQQQHPLVRRISQIDPGQESEESDVEDVLDEREEELEKAREDVILVRERLDGLLERAESRVDGLTSEKEKLESKLAWYQNELDRSETQRRSLKQDLDKIRTDIRHLNTVLQGADKSFKEQNDLIAGLRKEKLEKEIACNAAERELANLSSTKLELESALATTRYEHNNTAGRLRSLEEVHKSTAATLRSKLADVQRICSEKDDETTRAQSTKLDLEQKLEAAEVKLSETRAEHESRFRDLMTETAASKQSNEQALRDLKSLRDEHDRLIQTREDDKSRVDDLTKSVEQYRSELDAALHTQERLVNQVKADKAMHEQAIRDLQNGHGQERGSLEEALRELKTSHALDLKDARNNAARELLTRHADELARLRADSDGKLEAVKTDHANAIAAAQRLHDTELEARKSDFEAGLQALKDKLENAKQNSDDVSAAHATEIDTVRAEAVKELESTKERLNVAERRLEEVEKTSASRIDALESAVVAEKHDNVSVRKQLAEVEFSSHERVAALEAQLKDFEQQVTSLEDEIADMEKSGNVQLNTLTHQLASRAEDFSAASAELTSLRERTNNRIADMEAAYRALSLEAEKRQQQLEEDHQNRISRLKVEHRQEVEDTLEKADEKHRESLRRVEEETTSRIQQLKDDLAREEQRQRIERETEFRAMRLEADAAHEKALDDLRNEFTKQQADGRSKHESERAHLESLIQSLREQHQESIANMHRDHEAQILDITDRGSTESKGQIDELRTMYESRLGGLEEAHRKALGEMTQSLASAEEEHQAQLRERDSAVESRVRTLEEVHDREITSIRKSLKEERDTTLEVADAGRQRREDELTASHNAALSALRESFEAEAKMTSEKQESEIAAIRRELETAKEEVTDLQQKHSEEINRLQNKFDNDKHERTSAHQNDAESLRRSAAEAIASRNSIDAEHTAAVDKLKSSHSLALNTLQARLDTELVKHSDLVSAYEEKLQAQDKANAEVKSHEQDEFNQTANKLKADFDKKLEDLKESHAQADSDREAGWAKKIDELSDSHARALEQALQKAATELRAVQNGHAETLAKMTDDTRSAAKANDDEVARKLQEAIDSAVEKVRQSSQAEVQSLKQRHHDAIKHVRSTAQKQYVAQLNQIEEAHAQDMIEAQNHIAALEASRGDDADERAIVTPQSHQDEITKLQIEHQTEIADLKQQLQEELERVLAAAHADHESEMQAVKARLDASLTGQAEAERSLAILRRRDSNSDKGSQERRASEFHLRELEAENHNLKRKLSVLQVNLRPSSRRTSRSPTKSIRDGYTDVASLQLQTSNVEEEREAMRRALSKRTEEKLDLVHQNEFLVKELEASIARGSNRRRSALPMSDVLVQTDDVALEPRADFSVLQAVESKARTRIHLEAPARLSLDQEESGDTGLEATRSVEGYMDNAQTRLADRGGVDYGDQELREQSTSLHASEVQDAKDALAAAYNARVESLALDKEKAEEKITQKQQAAFAKEHAQLIASFGAHVYESDDQHPMKGLPAAQAIALQAAQQRLVADFNNRLARRKSQIALRHAYEFENLTADYDRKVAELLDDTSPLEGDLSVDPSEFERNLSEQQPRAPSRLGSERGRAARRPVSLQIHASPPSTGDLSSTLGRPRSPISPSEVAAGTSSSMLRASSAHVLGSFSKPRRGRIVLVPDEEEDRLVSSPVQKTPERHAPVAQHSLMRAKSPSDIQSPPRRNISNPMPFIPAMSSTPSRNHASAAQSLPNRHGKAYPPRESGAAPSPSVRLSAHVRKEEEKSKGSAPAKSGFLRRVREKFASDHTNPKRSSPSPSRPATSAGLPMTPRDPRPSSAASWSRRPKTAKLSDV